MFTGIKKYIQTSSYYSILFLVFLLLFLSTGQVLFHNHEPDLEHHHDCPAYQLYLLFSSTLIFECIYYLIILIFTYLCFISGKTKYTFFNKTYHSRAPPFQILKNIMLNSLKNRILNFQNLKGINPCIQILKGGVFLYLSPYFYS